MKITSPAQIVKLTSLQEPVNEWLDVYTGTITEWEMGEVRRFINIGCANGAEINNLPVEGDIPRFSKMIVTISIDYIP